MSLKTHIIKAEARWCKLLGDAPPGYDNGPAEWTVDAVLDEAAEKAYLASGGDPFYVKTNNEGERVLKFTRKALKSDGSASKPIGVFDDQGKEWDQTKLIGNGSILNFKYALNEIEHKKKKRLKPSLLSVQVWEHEPYKVKSDFPVKERDNNILEGEETAW